MKKIISILIISLLVSCGNIGNKKTNMVVKIPLKDTISSSLNDTVVDYITDYKVYQNDSNVYIGEVISLKDFKTKSLYKVNCKFCHGETGKGDGIKARTNPAICPHDLTKESNTEQVVYYIILNGKNDMPPYRQKLEDDKIKLLVIYIKKLKK